MCYTVLYCVTTCYKTPTIMLKNGWEDNKLAKLGDAIAISKSETMKDSLTDRGRCSEMLSHLKSTLITPAISTALHSGLL